MKKTKKAKAGMKILDGTERKAILIGAQEVFFMGMLLGYAGGKRRKSPTGTRVKVTKTRWRKTVSMWIGHFKMVDEWLVTNGQSDASAGTTTIFFKLESWSGWLPVWRMSYQGSYPKEVIPFLKEVLCKAYQSKLFRGGRGPFRVKSEKLFVYFNLGETADFSDFYGHEYIEDAQCKKVGQHDYMGMSLI